MISDHDLYDITAAFIRIRSDIDCNTNSTILTEIVRVIKSENDAYEDNQIRRAIASVKNIDRERWDYVYHENVYVHRRLLKDKLIYRVLAVALDTLVQLLEDQQFERAYDLVDTVHCFPNIIEENNLRIPKSFWKTYVACYRAKWDKSFLTDEQKQYNKSVMGC
ncbi:MAG: hypothetical protein ACI3XR_00885 [Eubacteriales bacterium]